MNYSAELIEILKKIKGFTKDAEVVEVLPKTNKGNLSQIKSGKRNLTEEQAIWIAEQCNLDLNLVLVNLAEETAKHEKAKEVWQNLAKTIAKTAKALAISGLLLFSQVHEPFGSKRPKHSP
jgi:phosphoenolpyruvate carboxylase